MNSSLAQRTRLTLRYVRDLGLIDINSPLRIANPIYRDVLVRWPGPTGNASRGWQLEAFELKVWRDGGVDPLERGLQQLELYLERLGLNKGTLVIFDRRTDALSAAIRTEILQAKTPKGYCVKLLRA